MDSANLVTMIKYGYRKGGNIITIYLFLILSLLLFSFCSQKNESQKNELSPKIKKVEPSTIWNVKENVISIFGENFIQGVEYNFSEDKAEKIIFRVFLEGEDQSFDLPFLCESEKFCKAYIKEGMPAGLYKLVVINYYGLRGDYPIRVIKFLPPVITSVSRENISNASEQEVFVFGEYFDEITGVFLNENKVNFYTVSSTEISFRVPRGFPKGSYTLKVFNSEGSSAETKINVFDGASIKVRVLYPENIFKNSSFPVDFEVKNVGGLKADLNFAIIFGGKEISTGEISLSPEESKKLSYSVPITEVQEIFLNVKGKDIYGGEVEASLKEIVYAKCSEEICDGKDNDCDGIVDNGVLLVFMKDKDNDGYSDGVSQLACTLPSPNFKPVNEILGYDCNDDDPQIYSGKPEVCDGKDNDCDGIVDNGVLLVFMKDKDRDGYSDGVSQLSCALPSPDFKPANEILGYDCNDEDPEIYSGKSEICDYKDNDCDGLVDEGVRTLFWIDNDRDGYGDKDSEPVEACFPPTSKHVQNNLDCDDSARSVYPGAPLVCGNLVDEDCDGNIEILLWEDKDGDSYTTEQVCANTLAEGLTSVSKPYDCNDLDPLAYPGAYERLNNQDDDCDGIPDDNLSPIAEVFFTSATSIGIRWEDRTQDEEKFVIEYSDRPDFSSFSVAEVSQNVTQVYIQQLLPETTYFFRVYAQNSLAQTSPSQLMATTSKKEGKSFVASGSYHTCAIKEDYSLWCWGENSSGQLGIPELYGQTATEPQFVMNDVHFVSVNEKNTCAIKKDGTLWCWGDNQYGQIGDGSFGSDVSQPTFVMDQVLKVSVGYRHTCAIKSDGSLWCWGNNQYGQVGDGSMGTIKPFPGQPIGMSRDVADVSAGLDHTCAVKTDGSLWCWGGNDRGQLGDGTNVGKVIPKRIFASGVKKISTGAKYTCAIKNESSLWCWGENNTGQLGLGIIGGYYTTPQPVTNDVIKVSTGWSSVAGHTCAVKSDSSIFCWGNNSYGQLGNGSFGNNISSPSSDIYVDAFYNRLTDIYHVSVGNSHTCAVDNSNQIWCWGNNYYGQLGIGKDYNYYETYYKFPRQVTSVGKVKGVSGGYSSTCVIKEDNSLWCWGGNDSGQLGDGTFINRAFPHMKITDNVFQISISGYHTCAIISDNSLWCWGSNLYGQLGLGFSGGNINTPQKVTEEVASVSVGGNHTCSVKQDNSLLCWGYNQRGQLGDGTNIQRESPYPVKISDIVISVSSVYEHTCALMSDRSLWCWGNNSYGQLGSGSSTHYCGWSPCNKNPTKIMDDVVQFSAGGRHTCAVKTDGSLWCWGYNLYGQLGDGYVHYPYSNTPVQIMSSGVSSVALGGYHTCAVKTDGSLWCWGYNYFGQLGDGTSGGGTNKNTPVPITSGVSSVALGWHHTCAVKTDGSLWCWGYNYFGQLGDGHVHYPYSNTPVQIMSSGVSSVALGWHHTCAVKTDGSLWCWGANWSGQLGDETDGSGADKNTPVQIMSSGVSSVALGGSHTCAVKQDGSLWCWGANWSGQLGDGYVHYPYSNTPVQIMSSGVSSVALGGDHTCAVKQDGSLWCWGDNEYGQLGNGTQLQKTTPYPVITPAGALSISVGGSHSCAIKTDGSLWCWGNNSSGQLGNGESGRVGSYFPSQVSPPMLSDVSFVSLGGEHSCAVKIDGSLWCWGYNGYGQLGDGTYTNRETPVQIMSSGVSSVALGPYHTCAVKQDGSLYCWGSNLYGQVGVGPEGDVYYSPVTVMQDVLTVSAGYYHTCAIKIDGTLWCWGWNYYGQVDGNGTFATNEAFARKVTFSYSSPAPRLKFIYKDNNNKLSGLRDTNEISQPYSCLSFGIRAFDLVSIIVVIYFFAKRRSLLKLVNLKNERKIRIKERR
jgi:alpha-tubulin suppressor-like RCC1 family protein